MFAKLRQSRSAAARLSLGGALVLAIALSGCSSSDSASSSTSSTSPATSDQSSAPAATTSSGAGTAASGSAGPSTAGSATADGALAATVPEEYRKKGSIAVGLEYNFPPFTYFQQDQKTLTGVDSAVIAELGKRLGIPFTIVEGNLDSMVPGLEANRYDVFWSSISESPQRLKQLTFVDYAYSSTGWLVAAGNPKKIEGYDTMCGITAAVAKGSVHVTLIGEASDKCVAAGKPAITQQVLGSSAETVLAVQAGRADLAATSIARATYIARTSNGVLDAVLDTKNDPVMTGVAFRKDNVALAKAVAGALQSMIDDGTYKAIFEKEGVGGQAIPKTTVRSDG